jgi:hypothetical protein
MSEATYPWGNRIRCHEPQERFGPVALGMPVIECAVPLSPRMRPHGSTGKSSGLPRPRPPACPHARIAAGLSQELVFRETGRLIRPYDGAAEGLGVRYG